MAALDPIAQFYAKFGRYPGNNKQWWVARADSDNPDAVPPVVAGDFMPELLDKLFSGNNRAPRGHFILNAFNKDRGAVSGLALGTAGVETIKERPNTITFFAGRVWYGCNSVVYFSQLLTDIHRASACYQEADPTSEDISDLIATDGGVIPIPEISKIIRLVPHGDGVLVFATNGVWQVTGNQQGFSAVDITVNKISPIGCKAPMSIVETESGIFWWSDTGIMGMEEKSGMYGPIPGAFERSNISEKTIQTLYNGISEEIKAEAKGVYDARNNRVFWLYRDGDVAPTQYNRVLIFDLSLSAFYPWKFSNLQDAGPNPRLKGFFVSERTVLNSEEKVNRYPTTIEYFAMDADHKGYSCHVDNNNFLDWESADGVGAPYESYIETGYELFNDAMKRKNITYLLTYLRQTEDVITPSGEAANQSSCYLTVKWDWANTGKSNKWTAPVQVYRSTPRFLPMEPGDFDTGFPISISKSKVRGNGKAIQFRYGTDEPYRNFDLHGWSITATGNVTT